MYVEDSRKYSFCQSFNPRENTVDSYFIAGFYCRGIDESRDRFKHFIESEPRGKVGSIFDITRITWLFRHHTIRCFEMQKSQISGRFLALNHSDKVSEKLF